MSRRCDLTGKGLQSGNNVSHSKRKTRRKFLPNLHPVSLLSDILKKSVNLRIAASTIRTVDHNGGLDKYLLSTTDSKLTDKAVKLKRQIKKAAEAQDTKKAS